MFGGDGNEDENKDIVIDGNGIPSGSDLDGVNGVGDNSTSDKTDGSDATVDVGEGSDGGVYFCRSEEHTSELQSP